MGRCGRLEVPSHRRAVAWAEPEVGAIATQSWIKASYGHDGLALLATGASAGETLERLLADDDGREQRQVGIVDREGRTAAYTGSACLEWAGQREGRGYTAQGNMLVSGETLAALAETFESSASAPLAERLIVALARLLRPARPTRPPVRASATPQRSALQVGLTTPRLGSRRGGPASLARVEPLARALPRRRPPLPSQQLCQAAVARKILIAAWHILSRNQPFKPAPRTTAGAPVPASSHLALAV